MSKRRNGHSVELNPSERLQQLRLEHADLDAQIAQLTARPYLSAGDETERKRLQKLKLAARDAIAALESSSRVSGD